MTPRMRERWISAAAVIVLHAGLAWLLLHVRAATPQPPIATALASFDVLPPPAPSPAAATERRRLAMRPAGRSARAGIAAERSAVAAPLPIIVPPRPSPAPQEPQAGTAIVGGTAAAGMGAGAGQNGAGSGSDGTGSGDGGGGSGTRARWLSGSITPRDYPKAERSAHIGGTVTVAFTVEMDGHARGCTVVQSSGNARLDATTCRLVEARFRYAPARDGTGAPISERRGWRQRWWTERDAE